MPQDEPEVATARRRRELMKTTDRIASAITRLVVEAKSMSTKAIASEIARLVETSLLEGGLMALNQTVSAAEAAIQDVELPPKRPSLDEQLSYLQAIHYCYIASIRAGIITTTEQLRGEPKP